MSVTTTNIPTSFNGNTISYNSDLYSINDSNILYIDESRNKFIILFKTIQGGNHNIFKDFIKIYSFSGTTITLLQTLLVPGNNVNAKCVIRSDNNLIIANKSKVYVYMFNMSNNNWNVTPITNSTSDNEVGLLGNVIYLDSTYIAYIRNYAGTFKVGVENISNYYDSNYTFSGLNTYTTGKAVSMSTNNLDYYFVSYVNSSKIYVTNHSTDSHSIIKIDYTTNSQSVTETGINEKFTSVLALPGKLVSDNNTYFYLNKTTNFFVEYNISTGDERNIFQYTSANSIASLFNISVSPLGNKVAIFYKPSGSSSNKINIFYKTNNTWSVNASELTTDNPDFIASLSVNYLISGINQTIDDANYQGIFYNTSTLQEQQTLVISDENNSYFGGDVTGLLSVDSSYREYRTETIYTFSNPVVAGRSPPEFYVKFWTDIQKVKDAINVKLELIDATGTGAGTFTSADALITSLYNNINSVPTNLLNAFTFNQLTSTTLIHPGGAGTINNRFKEMKWNHNSVNTNVSLPDFFKTPKAFEITPAAESNAISVNIDVSGITTYSTSDGSVKLPFNLTASTMSRTYTALNSPANSINVMNITGTTPGPTDQSLTQVSIPTQNFLNEASTLSCTSTLSSIDIPDAELNSILYDLMRKYKATSGAVAITTLTGARNLIDGMSGIVSTVASVPLSFYVAVRLFNPDNTSELTGAVGAGINDTGDFTNMSGTAAITGQTMPSPAKQLATNSTSSAEQNFPQSITATTQNPASQEQTPGVIAARNLKVWIVFKQSSSVTNPSLPVNPNAYASVNSGTTV